MAENNITSMIITVVISMVVVGVVMIPIFNGIAKDNGEDDGGGDGIVHTNKGVDVWYYMMVDENTNIDIYLTPPWEIDNEHFALSYEPISDGTVTWPTADVSDSYWNYNLPVVIGDDVSYGVNGANQETFRRGYSFTGEEDTDYRYRYLESPLQIRGTTMTATIRQTQEEVVFENIRFISAPESLATHTYLSNEFTEDFLPEIPYVGDNSFVGIYVDGWESEPELTALGYGWTGDEFFDYKYIQNWNEAQVESSDAGTITVEDGYLTGFSFTDSSGKHNYEIIQDDSDYIYFMYVPISVSEGGGSGGSSDSGSDLGTAGTIIGIIPIFVILSIVMYAVQYLRGNKI